MRMINDWRAAWRFFSVQAMTAALALQGAWAALPPDLKSRLPDGLLNGLSVTLLCLGLIGRLIRQEGRR